MSLQRRRFLGSVRCLGRHADAFSNQSGRRTGRCVRCGRWFELTKLGRIRPHVDYDAHRREAVTS